MFFKLSNHQIIKYFLIGVCSVLIDMIMYFVLIEAFGINHELSKKISFGCGAIWSFIGNKYYTFQSKSPFGKEIIMFYLLYIATFFINSYSHDIIWNLYNIAWLSFFVATFISVTINFLGQKFIVFKK